MPCKTIGIRTIQINMHEEIVKILTDVQHVSELKKNLISFGVLESNGCWCTAEGGDMSVSKGVLVVMRGQWNGNLYVLQGNMASGIATVSSSIDSSSDITRLWHMQSSHSSERGMIKLSKKNLFGGQRIGKLDFYEHCVFRK